MPIAILIERIKKPVEEAKGKNLAQFCRQNKLELRMASGVYIKESGKAWITQDVVKSWVDVMLPLFSWGQKRALLLWDATSIEKAWKVDEVMIPAGMTGFLQSLDIGVNRPLKQYMREVNDYIENRSERNCRENFIT